MQIEKAIQTAENCRYCLMCRHVAPMEYVTHLETLSPHGLGLLIASVQRGLLTWNKETVDILYSDPDGGNSRAHCVTDQPLPGAIAAMRAVVYEQKLAPQVVYEINQTIKEWKTPFEQKKPLKNSKTGMDGLFVGDEAQYLWPDTVSNVIKVLEAVGIEPVLVGTGHNNGFIPSSLGLYQTARELANSILSELRDCEVKRLFVLSPGDHFTFSKLFEERLDLKWPDNIEIIEVIQFLEDQFENQNLEFKSKKIDIPYAYLDPTHAVRNPTRHEAPRKLLRAVFNGQEKELFWRRERAHPVGSTALQFTKPNLAALLTRARIKDAQESGARLLVCEDPGTLHKMVASNESGDFEIQSLYKLLVDQIV